MKKIDIAVVGSGIGGSLFAKLNNDKNLVLFEKDSNLGGCASTFKRYGHHFNSGATTFVGYEDGHVLKNMFDKVGFVPNITKSEIAFRTIQNGKVVDRIKDFDTFLENLNDVYYHENNYKFWKKIKEIDEKFWKLKKVYFSKYSLKAYKNTASFMFELLTTFGTDIMISAERYIKATLPNISKEYKAFIDAQLLITLQTTSKNATLLSMSLGLAYPFHDVFYANKGMGNIFDELLKDVDVKIKEQILKITKKDEGFELESSKDKYFAKNVILNSTVFDSKKLFDDKKIIDYYEQFDFSDQSAFVVYLVIDSKQEFLNHYQILLEKDITNCISSSFFISLAKKDDELLSKKGISVTVSTHTNAKMWNKLKHTNIEEYEKQKEITTNEILNELKKSLNLKDEEVILSFSGTSSTFNNYINRINCGGKAINFSNVTQLPSAKTPFEGLYNVGDTVFAGQGWPGVAIGVNVLDKVFND